MLPRDFLTAMLKPLGVYVFNVLTVGLSNSNDLSEFALRELLQGLKGMVNIADLEVSWYSLEQYIGCIIRQAFNYYCSLLQV